METEEVVVLGCAANFKQVEVCELSYRNTTGQVYNETETLNLASLRLHLAAGLCRPCTELYTSYRRVHERAEDVEAMALERFVAMTTSLPAANVARLLRAILDKVSERRDSADILAKLPFTITLKTIGGDDTSVDAVGRDGG